MSKSTGMEPGNAKESKRVSKIEPLQVRQGRQHKRVSGIEGASERSRDHEVELVSKTESVLARKVEVGDERAGKRADKQNRGLNLPELWRIPLTPDSEALFKALLHTNPQILLVHLQCVNGIAVIPTP